ncbi:DUF4917 family protein [Marinobacter salarius]|uniref:DUF4917 family protein n=1 Tax=Marinobacter salarius TaxID=1420917 RepID=UPI00300A0080
MKTFQSALDSIDEQETLSLLIANGFSQAWDHHVFNYANLLEAADFADRDEQLRELFKKSETYDFERIMDQLVSAEKVLESYGVDGGVLERIKNDQEVLKSTLVSAIAETHPSLPRDVTDEQYVAVRKFLVNFSNIFSLNYDLLFYWARNMYDLEPEGYETDDGFRWPEVWVGHDSEQQVHFLHGGLHIYDNGADIKKHTFKDYEGISIIEKVRSNLKSDKFPLFVSEPSCDKKRIKIEHNPYLNFCFHALKEVRGTLFIFGHSMDENDKHIFDQINKSRVSRIFVSIHGDETTDANRRTIANARAFLDARVEFYRSESTPVWA